MVVMCAFVKTPHLLGDECATPRSNLLAHLIGEVCGAGSAMMACTDLSPTSDFRWVERSGGAAEQFVIMVEDVDGEMIIFHDTFVLRQRYAEGEYYHYSADV